MAKAISWVNALSTRPSLEAAVAEVVDRVQDSLEGSPDLGIVFISSAYASEYTRLVPLIIERLPLPVLIGCGGAGIVGMTPQQDAEEVEETPALSLSVAHLSGVEIDVFHIPPDTLPDPDSAPSAWEEVVGIPASKQPQFILFSDPFASRINDLLEGLDFAYAGSAKIGGLASAGATGTATGLFCYSSERPRKALYREGTVGVGLSGNIVLETIVAQGCRPIGEPYQITKGERNIVLEITDLEGGAQSRPPLVVLRDLIQSLSEEDRLLAQSSLFVGIARDEFKLHLEHGDFLIRNLLGVDPKLGAIAIGDRVRTGQRIQLHLRDARTSAEDLELLLQRYQLERGSTSSAIGALMFSCLGRGFGLYGQENFDSQLFRRYFQNIPLGGFFCSGEIGPVGGRTFLHGYTSAFGILRQLES